MPPRRTRRGATQAKSSPSNIPDAGIVFKIKYK